MMKFMRRSGNLGINGVAARWYDGNSRKHRIGEMREYAEEVAGHIVDSRIETRGVALSIYLKKSAATILQD